MKLLFLLITLFIFSFSFSQQLYLPSKNLNDSLSIHKSMVDLSKQALKLYKEENKEKYLDNRFRLEMTAEEYEKSLLTLDSLKKIYSIVNPKDAQATGFAYYSFSAAKLYQIKNAKPFNESYKLTLSSLQAKLTESQNNYASRYFGTEVQPLQKSFADLLKNRIKKDSIDLQDAKQLCRAYISYIVYKNVIPVGKPFFEMIENKSYIIEDSILIKTKDGSSIQAIVVRNKKITTQQPAILMFNIYIGAGDKTRAKNAAMNGYVGIVANTRGKGLSPQKIEPFEQDANDAYDIIDWISKQSWCNGKVGMYGGSYLGFSQWASTKNLHPALKTIIPQVSVGIGIDYPMENNVFMSYMLRWIHLVTNNKQTDQADFENDAYWNSVYTNWYRNGLRFRNLDSVEGRKSEIFQRWLQHPSYDSYWQNMVPYRNDFSKINIPVLTITGYFDDDQLGAMYYYKEHLKYNKNANHTLLIGPYDHFGSQGTPSTEWQGYKIDSVANISITDLLFKWFDYTLKDGKKPEILKDKVNYEVMGTNTWRHTSSITTMCNDTLQFYLSNIRSGNYYKLLTKKPAAKEFIQQEVDYLDRRDTSDFSDEKVLSKEMESGDYISFISEPFEKSISINATFFGELKHVINKKDYDLNIRLYEQLPDGRYFNLSHFLGRASYIKNQSKRQLLTPGNEEIIPFSNSFFTSKQLHNGSRLIVLIGVNKNKYWQVNYGTGKDVSDETILDGKTPLQIQWFNDSYIKIPVWRDK